MRSLLTREKKYTFKLRIGNDYKSQLYSHLIQLKMDISDAMSIKSPIHRYLKNIFGDTKKDEKIQMQ